VTWMTVVLGDEVRAGDLLGTLDQWPVRKITTVVPGSCTDRAAALAGACPCSRPGTSLDAMPRRWATGNGGSTRLILDHVRHAVHR
jgi:hypothetical protein